LLAPLWSISYTLTPGRLVSSCLLLCILFIIVIILYCNEFVYMPGSKMNCKLLEAKLTHFNFSIPVWRTFNKHLLNKLREAYKTYNLR
jgi:hypothetical protein